MNIKFSQKKQEIREDPVLVFFLNAKNFTAKYANYIIGSILGIAVVVGIVFIYLQAQKSGVSKAQDGFGRAMIEFNNRNIEKAVDEFKSVVENHPGTPSAAESALILGSIFFNMGNYDDAVQWFEKAEAGGKTLGFVPGEAREGLASCYEAKGEIPRALEYLGRALLDEQVRYRHAAVRWKMALLSRQTNETERAKALCREILSDTTAAEYRQRAENLLAVLEQVQG